MKKYCTFPDQTKVEISSILNLDDTHTYICYYYENIAQVLWVRNDFITND